MVTLEAYGYSDDLPAFLWWSLITFLGGLPLVVRGRPDTVMLRPREIGGYLVVFSQWLRLVGRLSYRDSQCGDQRIWSPFDKKPAKCGLFVVWLSV